MLTGFRPVFVPAARIALGLPKLLARQIAVAVDGFSEGNARDLPPDTFLKISPGQVQRQGEFRPLACEIFIELRFRLPQNWMLAGSRCHWACSAGMWSQPGK